MSVWTEVTGYISLRKGDHFSLKKNVKTFWLDYEHTFWSETSNLGEFTGTRFKLDICLDGFELGDDVLMQWIDHLCGDIDISVTKRYISYQ
jgi:hypothetical protein